MQSIFLKHKLLPKGFNKVGSIVSCGTTYFILDVIFEKD